MSAWSLERWLENVWESEDGPSLRYLCTRSGLSRWGPETGERTGQLPDSRPSHYHRGARELIELRDGRLIRQAV